MTTKFHGSGQPLDFSCFVKEVSWANEDFPEANCALLEGLRAGFTGYVEDKIIQPPFKMQSVSPNLSSEIEHATVQKSNADPSSPDSSSDKSQPSPSEAQECPDIHDVLHGTSIIGPLSRPNSAPPLKRNSALTVRPTIGEERKAWIMEAKKAYYLAELQRTRPNSIGYSLDDDQVLYRYQPEHLPGHPQSHSCPDFQRLHCNSRHVSREAPEGPPVEDKDSCTILYRLPTDSAQQGEIRLSPRIEKLDNLIPKTSKEFQSTMLYVNTIFPQPSSSQTNHLQEQETSPRASQTYAMIARMSMKNSSSKEATGATLPVQSPRNEVKMSEPTVVPPPPPKPDTSSTPQASTLGKSYKEAFLFGQRQSPVKTTPVLPKKDAVPQKVPFRSSSSFPSLHKLESE